jgi:adenylate cyclase
MAIEIERKFLVKGDFRTYETEKSYYRQGYIPSENCSIRIRITDKSSFITIKGPGDKLGISRFEWEKQIPEEEADELFNFCTRGSIEKIRHFIPAGKHIYEVDEFLGKNQGLIIAEIELNSIEETFEKPDWLGKEVTGIKKYYNGSLARLPYSEWTNEMKNEHEL